MSFNGKTIAVTGAFGSLGAAVVKALLENGATVAAIEGLGRPLNIILGGDGKGQDFSPLADPVARHARADDDNVIIMHFISVSVHFNLTTRCGSGRKALWSQSRRPAQKQRSSQPCELCHGHSLRP